jgi:hypothetical protein
MQSKIWIDIDEDNQPIIRIDYRPSSDVKDKMVKRFMDTFDKDSWFATFFMNKKGSDPSIQDSGYIRPIPVKNFGIHLPDMKMVWEKFYESQQIVEQATSENKEQ